MQVRAMVAKCICECSYYLSLRPLLLTWYKVFDSLYYLMFSLLIVVLHTRDERQATANICFCAHFFYLVDCLVCFFKIGENEFPGVYPLFNFTVCDRTPPCLHTIFTSFTNLEIIFFIKMGFSVQVDGTFQRSSWSFH